MQQWLLPSNSPSATASEETHDSSTSPEAQPIDVPPDRNRSSSNIRNESDAYHHADAENAPSPFSAITKDMLKQAGPNALRGVFVAGRYFLTAYFLGKIDEKLLAPNTLISLLESLEVVLGSRCLNIISTEVGRLNGLRQQHDIGAVVRQGSVWAATIGVTIGALYYFANHHILHLVGQDAFAVEEARKYFQAAAPGFLALMLFTVQQRFFQGIKYSVAALYSSAFHSALLVGLCYPFMFGKLGLPKLALTGAGYAFTAATWIILIAHTAYLYFAKWLNEYDLFKTNDTLNFERIKHFARVGIPSGIQCAIENASNITNSIFLGRIGGLTALTADQVSLQVAQFISIANNGLGGAVNPCVSNALGEKKYHDMRRYGHIGMLMGTVLPVLAFALLLPFHKAFTSIFIDTKNPENQVITDLAKYFLLWECLRQLGTAWQVLTSSALQGIKDTKAPMIAAIGFPFVFNLGLLFLLADGIKSNLETLYVSKAVGFFMAAIFNCGRWLMRSNEVDLPEQQKTAVESHSVCTRLHRGCSLFLGKPDPMQSETTAPVIGYGSLQSA